MDAPSYVRWVPLYQKCYSNKIWLIMEVITVCDRRHLGKLVILFADGAYVVIGVYRSNAIGVWQIFSGRQHDNLLNNKKGSEFKSKSFVISRTYRWRNRIKLYRPITVCTGYSLTACYIKASSENSLLGSLQYCFRRGKFCCTYSIGVNRVEMRI